METRWYVDPDKVLEETKIDERSRALHTNATEWNKIMMHLKRKQLEQEAIEAEEKKRKDMHDASYNMTKDWDNSIENINKRREEDRQKRIKQQEEERMESFMRLRSEQAERRREYVERKYHEMYQTKSYPSQVNAARLLSEVLYEREKQIEFQKNIEQFEREKDAEYAAKIKKGALEEIEENKQKKIALEKKKQEYKEGLLEQIKVREDEAKATQEKRLKLEQIDIVQSTKEIELIKKCAREEAEELKSGIKKEFNDFMKKQKALKEREKIEEEECNRVIEIQRKFKDRLACLSKLKQQELINESIMRSEITSKRAAQAILQKASAEGAALEAAAAEREKQEEEERLEKERKKEELKQDRMNERKRQIEARELKEFKDKEIRKWEMANRYKQNDHQKEHNAKQLVKKRNAISKYGEEIRKQIGEDVEKRKQMLLDEQFTLHDFAVDDKKFFDYAGAVIKRTEKEGRSATPILKVIEAYKKENELTDRTKQKPCKHLK